MRRMAGEELPGRGQGRGPGSLGAGAGIAGTGVLAPGESGPRDEPGLVRKPVEPAVRYPALLRGGLP